MSGPPPGAGGVLKLTVLGSPSADVGETAVGFRTRKEFVLLVYLALAWDPQLREHLAGLFWPDRDSASARHLPRMTLNLLRRHLGSANGIAADA